MLHSEVKNFVVKFHQLWKAGHNAHLNVDSHAGHAWCGLRVDLGVAPAAPHHRHQQHQQVGPGQRRHAPSYRRRLDARAAARAAKEAEAEEASAAKKAAEEASITRVTEAVIAVGTGVAATAKKINDAAEASEKAAEEATAKRDAEEAAAKKAAEEAATKKAAEEAATKKAAEEAATKKATEEAARKRAHEEAEEASKLAEEAERNKEQNSDLNVTAAAEEVCTSTRLTDDANARKHPRDWPAPEWFCEALATYRIHHGNVKFLISDLLGKCMNHPDTLIQHHKFIRRLWIYMSYLPLNKEYFDPVNTEFESVFGSAIVKWTDLRAYLQDHVYFNSSLVGVFSGKKLPGAN